MPRKKVDNRIRVLVENGVSLRQRTLFVIVGDKARDQVHNMESTRYIFPSQQVVILHHMLSKAVIGNRPSVLWCYKRDLGFSTHRKKRMKQLQRKKRSGTSDVQEDNPFELFISATSIRYCYYSETHRILGNTYGMCILQVINIYTLILNYICSF